MRKALVDFWVTKTAMTRVSTIWLLVTAMVTGVFLGLAASETSPIQGFNILAGTVPENSITTAGPAAVVLSILGYLLVPAIIALVVSSVASSRSAKRLRPIEDTLTALGREFQSLRRDYPLPPPAQ